MNGTSDPTAATALSWLGMGAGLLVATVVALGLPNVGLATGLLSGAYPTVTSAVAFASLLCYVAVLGVLLLGGICLARSGPRWLLPLRPSLAIAFLVAGILLLGISVAGRLASGGQLCCGGSPAQIHEAVSLVR